MPGDKLRRGQFRILILLFAALFLASCQTAPPAIEATPNAVAVTGPDSMETGPPAPTPRLLTFTPTAPAVTATPTSTPAPSPTPDPYEAVRLVNLVEREYGGGEIEIQETIAVNSYFTRTLITYPSDGLAIYGFMNTPHAAEAPLPVVIALHGYIDPEIYDTIDYTTRYADGLARAGFLVVHPNLRGYPPSDSGDNLFRVGMAVDVLNLIEIIKEQAGKPGPLEQADPERIGLWGHSMGGGVATRVMTVSPEVDAVVLYAAMSGDERQNYEAINDWSDGLRGLEELAVPEEELTTISPVHYFDRIRAAVSIHHGRADELVPLNWSIDTCQRLQAIEVEVECFWHKNQPHTFYGDGDLEFEQQVIAFFDRELRKGE